MQRLLKYFKGYIQRGFRECNDNEPQAQTLNVTILVIGFCGMFAGLMNLIFSPESFAFIGPSLIFLTLILEQFRYRLTIKMVGGFYIIAINLALLFRLYNGGGGIDWVLLALASGFLISIIFTWRWLLSYYIAVYLSLFLLHDFNISNKNMYIDLQVLIAAAGIGLLTLFYNSRLQELRNQAERQTQDLKRFLASFSHELRSPLQSIIGTHDIIKEKIIPEHENYLLSAQRQSNYLLRTINDILTFSKSEQEIDGLRLQPTSVVALLESEYKEAQLNIGDKPITLELSIDENIPSWVNTDSDRLHQIIQNLLSNAIKYTDTGTIHLSAEHKLDSTGLHNVTFIISDTGQGMTREQLTHVANAFYQTSYINHGTGLGLYICENLLRAFGSQLHIQSTLGSGSTFSFEISFMTPLEEVNELLQTDTDLSLLTAHIDTVVIVDDSEINIAILTEQLKMCNVNVISFLSGKACIDFCQTNDAFDVILMDMMMPNMSGIDASRALREMGISQPIIAISAANEQFKVKFTDVVNNLTLIQDELNKPFTALSISKSLNAVCQ